MWLLGYSADIPEVAQSGRQHEQARQLPRQCVAESFFQLLKRERIRRRTYIDREEARRDIFYYIEMFYNPKRRHGYANRLSPVEFEEQYFNRLESV
jgi:putative transposase